MARRWGWGFWPRGEDQNEESEEKRPNDIRVILNNYAVQAIVAINAMMVVIGRWLGPLLCIGAVALWVWWPTDYEDDDGGLYHLANIPALICTLLAVIFGALAWLDVWWPVYWQARIHSHAGALWLEQSVTAFGWTVPLPQFVGLVRLFALPYLGWVVFGLVITATRYIAEILWPNLRNVVFRPVEADSLPPLTMVPPRQRPEREGRPVRRRVRRNADDTVEQVAAGVLRGNGEAPNAQFVEIHEEGYVPFPLHLFDGGRRQAADWARWTLADAAHVSARGATAHNFVSQTKGRQLYEWLVNAGAVVQGEGNQRTLTGMGRWLLMRVREGEAQDVTLV